MLAALDAVARSDSPVAGDAALAISALGGAEAREALYGMCSDLGIDHAGGAAAEALALALRDCFEEVSSRTGDEWERAARWVTTAYGRRCTSAPSATPLDSTALALLEVAVAWRLVDVAALVESEVRGDRTWGWFSTPITHLRWRLLAHVRPDAFAATAQGYELAEMSDGNRPAFARALAELTQPVHAEFAREAVCTLARGAKALVRRKIADAIAQAERVPEWVLDIEPSETNAPFLRDLAALCDEHLGPILIGRLLGAPTRSVRRYGQEAEDARRRQAVALAALQRFLDDENPFRRL